MTTLAASNASALPSRGRERSLTVRRLTEGAVKASLIGCATFSILTTTAIVAVLTIETVRFFGSEEASVWGFLTGLKWSPLLGAEKFFGI